MQDKITDPDCQERICPATTISQPEGANSVAIRSLVRLACKTKGVSWSLAKGFARMAWSKSCIDIPWLINKTGSVAGCNRETKEVTLSCAWRKLSPPKGCQSSGAFQNWRAGSPQRASISGLVRPSHSPKCISARASEVRNSSGFSRQEFKRAAVLWARLAGEHQALENLEVASQRPAAKACCCPNSVRGESCLP